MRKSFKKKINKKSITIVDLTLHFLHGGSTEITLTLPLNSFFDRLSSTEFLIKKNNFL